MTVETLAEECTCVSMPDVFVDVTVLDEEDDGDPGGFTYVTTSINWL